MDGGLGYIQSLSGPGADDGGQSAPKELGRVDVAGIDSDREEDLKNPKSGAGPRAAREGAAPIAKALLNGMPETCQDSQTISLSMDQARGSASSGFGAGGSSTTAALHAGHSHGTVVVPDMHDKGMATPILLAATLGVHSLLEGVGIGVQREIASSLGIVIAVVAHKGFAGFALGQLFLFAGATLRQAAPAVLVFSLATPIGIAIGVAVNAAVSSPWVDVVAVGLASGTFILVSLVEILLPSLEIERPGEEIGRGPRWLAFLVGVGAFAAVGYAINGSET